jgi:anthranilate synthase component 2
LKKDWSKAMKLLMIDNYDSFTYNIVQYFGELGAEVEVFRNDEITVEGIARAQARPAGGVAGPCSPAEAGISVAAIQHFAGKLPILGVCLGHQSIGAALGGKIIRAQQLMHGKTSVITTTQQGVFAGLPAQFTVNRYHSLAIERATCPAELEVTAWTDDGEIMGVRHKSLPIQGVQFHPESILTEHGHAMLKNFLEQMPPNGPSGGDLRSDTVTQPTPPCARPWPQRRWATTCLPTTRASTRCRKKSRHAGL